MNSNEILTKARELNEACNYYGVIELLEGHINETPCDKELLAIYLKNSANKEIIDLGVNFEKIYSNVEYYVFDDIPETLLLKLSETLFTASIAGVYLGEYTNEQKNVLVNAHLKKTILSLGELLNDYVVFKDLLEKMHKILNSLELDRNIYSYLAFIVDWKSKVSENIMRYLVEKAKLPSVMTEKKAIYEAYVNDLETTCYAFNEMPRMKDKTQLERKIATREEKIFWIGYFSKVKEIHEKEYDSYKQILHDENHEFHKEYFIGDHISDCYYNQALQMAIRGALTTEEIARFQISTNCVGVNKSTDISSKFERSIQETDAILNKLGAQNQKVNTASPSGIGSVIEKIKTFLNDILKK